MDATADDMARLEQAGGLADLSTHVKLRLTGPDAERYLNGQVSQDVRKIPAGGAEWACVCTHKGKLEALVLIARSADGFYISGDAALADTLPGRLEKYLIADDAVLEDVTEVFDLVHTFGSQPVPEGIKFTAERWGTPGADVWLPRGAGKNFNPSPAAALETLRIARGIPAWEPELSGGILPPEARLEDRCVDYYKGCYTGQEVISRLRSVGKVNRLLQLFRATNGTRLSAGWEIFSAAEPAGSLTSAAWLSGQGIGVALGFLRRQAISGILTAGPDRVPLTVENGPG
jgi:tRNA-modifying protein YgfZ